MFLSYSFRNITLLTPQLGKEALNVSEFLHFREAAPDEKEQRQYSTGFEHLHRTVLILSFPS